MPPSKLDVPIGIIIYQRIFNAENLTNKKNAWSRGFILFLTFAVYTCYHAARKPLSVVKTVLHQNCSGMIPPPGVINNTEWCSWVPFETSDSNSLFGLLDSSFLFAYAFMMFCSGFIAERCNLRRYLSGGLLFSGFFCAMFGMAKYWQIHTIWYFVVVQMFAGIFQTTGWPSVVTIMGNWFGREKNGVIFGIWNSHTSVGNILGTLIAGKFVAKNWGLSFIVPGALMMILSIFTFLFLLTEPVTPRTAIVNQRPIETEDQSDTTGSNETEEKIRVEQRPILSSSRGNVKAIGFFRAIQVPGVVEFSFCLFFSKLVNYTFLYWLPSYINTSTSLGAENSADLSVLFDVGGIFGGIIAGAISDATGMHAVTCCCMLVNTIPMLYLYYLYGGYSLAVSITLLMITGALVNGPYALITTAVSAELGLNPSIGGNTKALSTITAIIDGTGSIGAAVGPLLAGFVSNYMGWQYVFYALMVSNIFALLTLLRLARSEIKKESRNRGRGWTS